MRERNFLDDSDLWGLPSRGYAAINFLRPAVAAEQPRPQDGTHQKAGVRCCILLQVLLLLPLILLACLLVLTPSAIYFIPRDLLLNISSSSSSLEQGNMTSLRIHALQANSTSSSGRTCSGGFFALNLTREFCHPSCEDFGLGDVVGEFSVYRVILMAVAALACVTIASFLVLALTLQRKTIFRFPRIFAVYMCCTSLATAIVLLVGTIRSDLFCSHESFVQSKINATSFCTVSGILFSYTYLQQILWGTFQAFGLLYMACSPKRFAQSKEVGHLKLAHILSVIVAIFVPMVPVLIQLADEFQHVGVPAMLCLGKNRDYVFYTLSLPLSVFSVVPTVVIMLTGWTLLKRACNGIASSSGLSYTVQLKTLLVITYTIIAGLGITSCLAFYFIYHDILSLELTNLFSCEGFGDYTCPPSITEHVQVFQKLLLSSLILVLLLPVVIFLFNLELGCFKSSCGWLSRTKSQSVESVHSFVS